MEPIQAVQQDQPVQKVRSVSAIRWVLPLLTLVVAAVTAFGVADYAYAQTGGGGGSGGGSSVSTPVPDQYEVSLDIPPVNEDAIADTATSTFGSYQNVIWLSGGIAMGFAILRRSRRLLR